jgi:hypothetical protein
VALDAFVLVPAASLRTTSCTVGAGVGRVGDCVGFVVGHAVGEGVGHCVGEGVG